MYRLKESEKTEERAKKLMDEYSPSYMAMSRHAIEEYNKDVSNYRLYNNLITQEEFEPYCNPLGIDVGQINKEIKPYNKTYQNIDVLLGEELKLADDFYAYLLNSESDKIADMEFKYAVEESVDKLMEVIQIKARKQAGNISEEEFAQKYEPMLKEINVDKLIDGIYNFQTSTEIFSNFVIKKLKFADALDQIKNEGFFHALITDKEVVYVGSKNGRPHIEVMNPLFTFFEKSNTSKYIQDGDWAGSITFLTAAEVMENFGDEIPKDKLDKFENKHLSDSGSTPQKRIDPKVENTFTNRVLLKKFANFQYINQDEVEIGLYGDNYSPRSFDTYNLYEVVHMEWKWQRKVGFLSYIDEYGEEVTTIVAGEYPVPKDAMKTKYNNQYDREVTSYEWLDEEGKLRAIEYMWIPDIWEGYRIDGDIFVKIRRRPNQNVSLENPFSAKLSYHGRRFNSTNAPSISMMGRMKPFQFLYFVCMYQLGELVAKNKGPLIAMDASQIDPNLGNGDPKLALEKTLWYQQHGLIIYNSMQNTQGGDMPPTRAPGGQVVNASSTVDILNLTQILSWLEIEIGKAAGISPQRLAQFSTSTNVTDNQQAIAQSSHITEKYFSYHNKLWAEIIASYTNIYRDWAKQRIEDGKSVTVEYLMPNKMRQSLKVTPMHLRYVDMGVYVNSSGMSERYLQMMEDLTLTFAQNDGTIVDISNILKSRIQGTSPEELHEELLKAQKDREEREQAMQEQQAQMQQQSLEMFRAQENIKADAQIRIEEAKAALESDNDTPAN